ncbi:MAG: hypothetical protein IPK93_08065 [Solirubrobacterales bacterium]|nr:hypothetical protein [Solirubrobacterales bacterium]
MSFSHYLAGTFGLLAGAGLAGYIGVNLRARLLPGWSGPVAWTATLILAILTVILLTLLPGTFGLLSGWLVLLLLGLAAASIWRWGGRLPAVRGGSPLVHVPASTLLNWAGFAIAAAALGAFTIGMRLKLGTGMTGFDSTWYHGPFAAGISQSGDTFSLHFLAPQFLSWFYPQNSELFHALGMVAYGNDFASPLINVGWFVACLVAAWCIGRPYGGAPISLAGVAIVLVSTVVADQAGEARNDIVGTFFVLAALAILVNAAAGGRRITLGPVLVVAITAGLAAGTKVNFIAAALALVIGAIVLAQPVLRRRAVLTALGGVSLGGLYFYLRNLVHSGNPLPWINGIGPISLPGPAQDVGGRDAGSVLGYLTDTGVISDWFLPGFGDGFGDGWIILAGLVLVSFGFCFSRASGPARRTAAAVGLALVLAWLVAPTSAEGPVGEPRGFVSGLRYLAPAIAVAMALLGSAIGPQKPGVRWLVIGLIALLAPFTISISGAASFRQILGGIFVAAAAFFVLIILARAYRSGWTKARVAFVSGTVLVTVLAGQLVQTSYLDHRYENPDFTTPGLNKAFAWAQGVEGESIGTNATRQYPLFGKYLENDVQFIGVHEKHGGFVKTDNCEAFRQQVAEGDYDYLVLTLDRPSPKRRFPRESGWIAHDPAVTRVLRKEPTVIYRLDGKPDPALCGQRIQQSSR